MREGAHDSISINNIGFYFIINIFPSGHGEITPRPKHNYVNRTAAGQHQEAAQDRICEAKDGQGLCSILLDIRPPDILIFILVNGEVSA